jgi:hypothetical protein
LSNVLDVLARGSEAQDLDRFLHPAHPARGLYPEMGKLLLEGTAAGLGLPERKMKPDRPAESA